MKEIKRKCAKCGSSPADDPDTKLFRFPKPGPTNTLRCELWSHYCFPDKPWSTVEFQTRMHSEHKMLCHRHFKESSFVDFPSKKLRRFASPEDETPEDQFSYDSILSYGEFEKYKRYLQKISMLNTFRNLKNNTFMQKLSTSNAVSALSRKINPKLALLLQAELKNFKKNPKRIRWTTENKITALRLYKRSPTCYRLLRRMFDLPAPATLKVLLRKCVLNVGINKHIFEIIGKFANAGKQVDNEFVLLFDEMCIKKHLQYNAKEDAIEGFQDHDKLGRSSQPASYALVFMVASIRKRVKQPLAYYLSGSSVTADRLALLIKEVLEQCHKHGINIAATVCDMDGINRRALRILGATADNPYFEVNGHEVITLFDPPHLIKCFRNVFMKYDIECPTNISSNGSIEKGIAKWSHIVQFQKLDSVNPNFAMAPLLKQDHLNPNAKQKKKVKLAVQVLSHTVSTAMYATIRKGLSSDATVTAELISKIDKMYDTLNSDTMDLRRGKPFSTNMKKNTPHHNFIKEMKWFFKEIQFIGAPRPPPLQEAWLWTLNGVERLWRTLNQKHPFFKSLATRRLQTDPLINFFACIRANCGANCKPTTGQFIGGLKTSLLNNQCHIGVRNNREVDNNNAMINDFRLFLNNVNTETRASTFSSGNDEFESSEDFINSSETQACSYVCSFILDKMENNCETCKSVLTAKDHSSIHPYREFLKEYFDFKECLNYPHKNLEVCVEACAKEINNYLKKNAHKKRISKDIEYILKQTVNFKFLNVCPKHKAENVSHIIRSVFYITVKRFCIIKNRSFAEESSKNRLKENIFVFIVP